MFSGLVEDGEKLINMFAEEFRLEIDEPHVFDQNSLKVPRSGTEDVELYLDTDKMKSIGFIINVYLRGFFKKKV
jgi:hypothetical protein